MFERDDETAMLLRQATAMKDAGDLDGAIRVMQRARDRMVVSAVHHSPETWCRLALYLQQAGRTDEALDEIDWLIDDLPRRARKESFMDDPEKSFGAGTSKRTIYNNIVKTSKAIYERKRELILKRATARSKVK